MLDLSTASARFANSPGGCDQLIEAHDTIVSTRSVIGLFTPQCFRRIHERGAPRGEKAGEQRDDEKDERSGEERRRVERADAEEQALVSYAGMDLKRNY